MVGDALHRFLALTGIVILSPILLLVGLVIAVTLGRPVLFKQVRLGYQGRPFLLVKFRTMDDVRDKNDDLLPDATRLTRVGRFLRATSLDELPQLINVMKGDMRLVGPRPLLPEYRDLYSPEQWRRHEVYPGIAGPVQALGRNSLSWEEKFELDVWYVDNRSPLLDFQLAFQSLLRAGFRTGVSAEGHATMPRFTGASGDKPVTR